MFPLKRVRRVASGFVGIASLICVFGWPVLAAGELDPSFTASAFGTLNGNVSKIKIQPDGKLVIGGLFTEINGFASTAVARINPDGTVDTTFRSPDLFGAFGLGYQVLAVAIQSDGKILVGGSLLGADGVLRPGIRRLNADGSLDTSFFVVELPSFHTVWDIEIQSDGKILVGGEFTLFSQPQYSGLIRLNTDGTLDTGLTPATGLVRDIEIMPDGKILIGGGTIGSPSSGFLRRLLSSGAIDPTFAAVTTNQGVVEVVRFRSNGQIFIGGDFTNISGFTQGRISLINADGTLDLTFNQNNASAGNGSVNDIALRPDGKIIIGGSFSTYNTVSRLRIAQLNPDGSLDTDFQNNTLFGMSIVNDVELMSDGRLLVGINWLNNVPPFTRFNSDGTRDTTFQPFITRNSRVRKVLQQPDGKVLICGDFPFVNGVRRYSMARLNSDGSLDPGFVPFWNDMTTIPVIAAMALQSDGKIMVGLNGLPRRMNADGSEDTSFATSVNGTINDLAVLSNGQILLGGQVQSGGTKSLVRFNSNGTVDSSFATAQPNAAVNKILVQPDGQILIGGEFTQVGASIRGRVARLNGTDGSLDLSFNPPGGANGSVIDLALQPDGKVVLVGDFTSLNGGNNQVRIGRLLSNGMVDPEFASNANATVRAVAVQPDGRILLGGAISAILGIPRNGIARLNADGSIDTSFDSFANSQIWDITLQSDGKILIGGDFTRIDRISAVRIARLLDNALPASVMFDYDGDGKADVSVFRPSTNRWYIFKSSDSSVLEQTFGLAGDIITPADFDGDGKTDVAIFRPSLGDWWYLASTDGSQRTTHWGASGDIPRPSDFDADGKADFIVFRPSENNWYRLGSTGAISIISFGLMGDKPVRGDFDGDGSADPAIFRPSTGDWWYRSSINNAQLAVRWGISTDVPAPADFDGDSKTDIAVYRPSTGVWYIINSSNGSFTIVAFGLPDDKPVPADYDGDGRADIAVFRPSTGIWYLNRSTAGFTATQFGVSTDIATPNAFVP